MTLPIKDKLFADTGNSDQGERNFQHFLFKDLDFTGRSEPISFFRSDFRGVKVDNVKFYKNNFDRADFLNAYVLNSTFLDCFFGTDFTNVIFNNVKFVGNKEDTCAYYNCKFINCLFEEETIINTTNRNSTYVSCIFNNCTFKQNSFEDLHYSTSSFDSVSFADMGAYNLDFTSCNFNQTIVDPDYLGSYLIKDSDIKGLEYRYRGKVLTFTGEIVDDLRMLSIFYLENQRFYESLNSILIANQISNTEVHITSLFEKVIELINEDTHELRRNQQFEKIITMLVFYSDSKIISPENLFFIIGLLHGDQIKFNSLADRLKYRSNLQLLEDTVKSNLLELGIWNFDPKQIIYSEFEINEEDFEVFKTEISGFIAAIENEYGFDHNISFEIVGTRKGSLIVEIVQYAISAFCLATIAKSLISKIIEIKMEYKISEKTIMLLETGSMDDIKNWEKKAEIARRIQKKPSDEIYKKANPLLKLIKSFNIFPNTFFKRSN